MREAERVIERMGKQAVCSCGRPRGLVGVLLFMPGLANLQLATFARGPGFPLAMGLWQSNDAVLARALALVSAGRSEGVITLPKRHRRKKSWAARKGLSLIHI